MASTVKKSANTNAVPKEILTIICCPTDKADLVYDKKNNNLTCTKCKKVYEVKEGIPILLPK